MRHLQVLAMGLMFFSCQLGAQDKNKDFKVVRATEMMSYGGAAGSGSATTYSIQIVARRKLTLSSDSGFAKGKVDAFYIMADSFSYTSSKDLKKGDTAEIVLTIRDESSIGGGDFQKPIPGSPAGNPPKKSKGKLVIRYQGGKCKTLDINKLEKLETIFAP